MSAFLASLGGKLAERWLAGLLLPGVVFVGAVVVAHELGHRHWADYGRLGAAVDRFAAASTARSTGGVLVLAVAGVALAVVASMLAQGAGHVVVGLWTGTWGRVGRPLVRRRRRRWKHAVRAHEDALKAKARQLRQQPPVPRDELPDTAALAAARDRVAWTAPSRPTWIGDRLQAATDRVRAAYDLDLAAVWPRLWLVLPDEVRTQLAAAQTDFATAARTTGWGLLYVLLGAWWWPAAVIGVGVVGYGWWQGRVTADRLASLVESTVDLHGRALAAALGREVDGPFGPADGEAVTRLLRKGG